MLRARCSFIKQEEVHTQGQCKGRGRWQTERKKRQVGSKRQAANGQMRINSPGSQQDKHTEKTLRDLDSGKTLLGNEREEVQGL